MSETTENGNTLSSIRSMFSKQKPEFTAEYAWLETSYGSGTFSSLEKRIKAKQEYIRKVIEDNFPTNDAHYRFANVDAYYHCIVSIEEDLMCCVDDVFSPFVNGGFKVVCISDRIDEVRDENIYLISWKNIFKEKIGHGKGDGREDGAV